MRFDHVLCSPILWFLVILAITGFLTLHALYWVWRKWKGDSGAWNVVLLAALALVFPLGAYIEIVGILFFHSSFCS